MTLDEQEKLIKARWLLGDKYVIVPLKQWNKDVDDYKSLKQQWITAEKVVTVLLARMDGLMNEFRAINRITEDSILLTKNIIHEVKASVNK